MGDVERGQNGRSTIAAIDGVMAITPFSYLGAETAAVAAGKVRKPDQNVPRLAILRELIRAALVATVGT
jgi:APA family basic amino acid/polyamine antiporter